MVTGNTCSVTGYLPRQSAQSTDRHWECNMTDISLIRTATSSIFLLLVPVLKARMHALVALILVSRLAGLFASMNPAEIANTIQKGMEEIGALDRSGFSREKVMDICASALQPAGVIILVTGSVAYSSRCLSIRGSGWPTAI